MYSDLEDIYIYALRYTFGRMSYSSSTVISEITKILELVSQRFLCVVCRDIFNYFYTSDIKFTPTRDDNGIFTIDDYTLKLMEEDNIYYASQYYQLALQLQQLMTDESKKWLASINGGNIMNIQ